MTSASMKGSVMHVLAVLDAGRIRDSADIRAARGRRSEIAYERIPSECLPTSAPSGQGEEVDAAAANALARLAVRYDRLLRELIADGPVLPVRLGTTASDADALTRFVRSHDEELGDELDRLRDQREWHVRVRRTEPVPPPGAPSPGAGERSGTQYLLQARDRHRRLSTDTGHAIAEVDELIGEFACEARGALDTRGSRRAYLVRRCDEPRMTTALEQLAAGHAATIAVELTGPLPPYSFVRLGLEET